MEKKKIKYFECKYQAMEFAKKVNGKFIERVLPGYMATEIIYKVEY